MKGESGKAAMMDFESTREASVLMSGTMRAIVRIREDQESADDEQEEGSRLIAEEWPRYSGDIIVNLRKLRERGKLGKAVEVREQKALVVRDGAEIISVNILMLSILA